MKKKRVWSAVLSAALILTSFSAVCISGKTDADAADVQLVSEPVVTELPGTNRTVSEYNPSFLSVTGFAKEAVSDRTDAIGTDAYRVVNNEEEFLQALDDAKLGKVRVIEIAADLNLGWDSLSEQERAHDCISSYGWSPLAEVYNPSILENNVSQLTIADTHGLTIFSRAGNTVKYAEWKLQGTSSDIVIRNLKFDEMWNWSEAASTKELGWTLLKLNGVKGVWIDHCTFTLGSDGNVDSENGASNMTQSWNSYSLPTTETPGTDSMLYKTITYLEYLYGQGKLSDTGRYSLLRDHGASPQQIMAYEAYHQKLCLNGSGDKDFKDAEGYEDGNQRLHLTFAYNKVTNIGARLPFIRQGTAHLINVYLDNSGHMALHNDESLPFGEYGGWQLNCGLDAHNGACVGADTCVFNEAKALVGVEQQDGKVEYDSSQYPDGYSYAGMQVPFNYSFAGVYNHMLAVNSKVTYNGQTYTGSSWDNNGDNLFTVEYTWSDKSTIGNFHWFSSIDHADEYVKGDAPHIQDENGNITYIPFSFSYTDTLPYAYQALPLEDVETVISQYAGAYVYNEGPEFWLRTEYDADEEIMPVDQSQEILAEGLNISEETLEVRVGEARQLNADVVPSNASNREVLWTSSDPDCLQVLDSGLIIPLSEGTATVTATTQDGTEIEKTCVVTVSNPVTSIEILGARTMYLGDENTPAETLQLQAIVLPEDATDSSVIWTSSNPSALSVDENGLLTALKKSSGVRITCQSVSDPSVSATVRIAVKEGVNPNPSAEPSPSPEPPVYGDIDDDGYVTAADALCALRHAAQLTELEGTAFLAADVNGDQQITAADALYILQKAAQMIDTFPVEITKSSDI